MGGGCLGGGHCCCVWVGWVMGWARSWEWTGLGWTDLGGTRCEGGRLVGGERGLDVKSVRMGGCVVVCV